MRQIKCEYCDTVVLISKREQRLMLEQGKVTGYDPFKKFACPSCRGLDSQVPR